MYLMSERMLEEIETEELKVMIEESPLDAILRMREIYAKRAHKHNAQRSTSNWIYQFLGCLSVVMAVIVGGLDG